MTALITEQLADAPIGAWPMQDTAGTTMVDESGNGRDGTYVNVTLGATAIDNQGARSADFDGATSYATVAYAAWMAMTTFTVEVLVQADSVQPVGYSEICGQWQGPFVPGQFRLMLDASSDTYAELSAGGTQHFQTPVTLSPTTDPYLLAVRYDGLNWSLFKNGVNVMDEPVTGTPTDAGNPALFIGHSGVNTGPYTGMWWNGRMSHLAWYDSALSDARLAAHAAASGTQYVNLAPSPGGVLTATASPRGRVKLGMSVSPDGGPP